MSHTDCLAALAYSRNNLASRMAKICWALLMTISHQIDIALEWTECRPSVTERNMDGSGFHVCGDNDRRGTVSADERLSDSRLDPSFPEPPPLAPVALPRWAGQTPKMTVAGFVMASLAYQTSFYIGRTLANIGDRGSRSAMTTKDQTPGRRVFGILKAHFVAQAVTLIALSMRSKRKRDYQNHCPGGAEQLLSLCRRFRGTRVFSKRFWHSSELYCEPVDIIGGPPVDVEILTRLRMGEYHSKLNEAGGSPVTIALHFPEQFDCRGFHNRFGRTLADGSVALPCRLLRPVGYDGHLLYFQEDLVLRPLCAGDN